MSNMYKRDLKGAMYVHKGTLEDPWLPFMSIHLFYQGLKQYDYTCNAGAKFEVVESRGQSHLKPPRTNNISHANPICEC